MLEIDERAECGRERGEEREPKDINFSAAMSKTLTEMGPTALQHRDQVEEVKRRMGIEHDYSDCWIYNFLENKYFDVDETVAKLYRRDTMEREEIHGYEVTDFMREQMSKGLIQLIGDDRDGRVIADALLDYGV